MKRQIAVLLAVCFMVVSTVSVCSERSAGVTYKVASSKQDVRRGKDGATGLKDTTFLQPESLLILMQQASVEGLNTIAEKGIVYRLANLKANVNVQDQETGRTSLHVGMTDKSNPKVVEALLNSKANPAIHDVDDLTPLDVACRTGVIDGKFLQLLAAIENSRK